MAQYRRIRIITIKKKKHYQNFEEEAAYFWERKLTFLPPRCRN